MEFVIFFSFVPVVFFGFYLNYRLQQTLKTRFPEVWLTLGKPDQFSPTQDVIFKQSILRNYIKNKEYLALKDPEFTKQCNFLRFFNKISIVLLIVFFVSIYFFVIN